jgi:N4-(beta-N-acetylglucosaminyl)-L-asparaginase
MSSSRREFLATTAAASALAFGSVSAGAQQTKRTDQLPQKKELLLGNAKQPVIICKTTGNQSIDGAYTMLQRGGDTLDAALFVCRAQEDDPTDSSVGLGGLPNEEGVVELDACCVHGPTRRMGSVAAVRNIKNVSTLARMVMEHTGHVMLVGEGAERFAVARGLKREDLLTERSRKIWQLWKEQNSIQDWWGPGIADPDWKPPTPMQQQSLQQRYQRLYDAAARLGVEPEYRDEAIYKVMNPPRGTIHVSVVNTKGEMSGATTTSGLAWKLPGRVGDSPILGAGCWTDQDVGSAGAIGNGEECIKIAGAHTIVELMRTGMEPKEAGLEALRRISRNHNDDNQRLAYMDMIFFVLRKDGAYAGVSLWSHRTNGKPMQFLVHDGTKRIEDCTPLLQGHSNDWPPTPKLPEEERR